MWAGTKGGAVVEVYFDVHLPETVAARGRPPQAFPRGRVREVLLAEAAARGRALTVKEVDTVAASIPASRSETRRLWRMLAPKFSGNYGARRAVRRKVLMSG